jgi:twitching motility protein PilT
LNRTKEAHILTLEDPIEFVHRPQMSFITQKEIGLDVSSFEQGLKAAFSENPDIVLVGEIRDQASMTSALDLAESGVFVLATLHTMDVANTVKRVISFYRDESQFMIRSRFATNVAGVVSMRLLPAQGGGRLAAFEVMISNTAFCSLIQEKKEHQIESFIEQGKSEGMKTFGMDIRELLTQRRISKDTADMYLKAELN